MIKDKVTINVFYKEASGAIDIPLTFSTMMELVKILPHCTAKDVLVEAIKDENKRY